MAEQQSAEEKQRLRTKEWRESNREHIKAYQKEWRAKNAQSVSAYQKTYHAEYRAAPDVQFDMWMRNLQRNYKLTPADFNRLWEHQSGRCAICSIELAPRGRKGKSACVDHNHHTGKVRALLCRHCNHGIGCLKDSPSVLRAAATYLEKYGNYSTSIGESSGK